MGRLCPQNYDGRLRMVASPCDGARCGNWAPGQARCTVATGAESLPAVAAEAWPSCPLQAHCQHHLQSARDVAGTCTVRRAGLVCVSALATLMPYPKAEAHDLAYHGDFIDPDAFWEEAPQETVPVVPRAD